MDYSYNHEDQTTSLEDPDLEIDDIEELLDRVKYTRTGEYADNFIFMMCPLEQGVHEYSVPIDSSKKFKKILNYFFSSLNDNEELDIENLQNLINNNHSSDESIPPFRFEYKALDFMVHAALVANRQLNSLFSEKEQNHAGLSTAFIVLNRVISTLQSVSLLLKNGYFSDAKCLLRVALEQIAYAYQCIGIDDAKIIRNLKKPLSIKNLKELIPEAGMLYGYLSDFIHNNNTIWSEFIDIEPQENLDSSNVYIKIRSGEKSRECAMFAVRIIESYLAVIYQISKDFEHNNKHDIRNFISIHCELSLMIRTRYYEKTNESEPKETV